MLLAELRLNATHRELLHPEKETSDTGVAANYGFNHFGRLRRSIVGNCQDARRTGRNTT